MMDRDLFHIASHVAHYMPGYWRLDRRPIEDDRRYLGVRILGADKLAIRLQDGECMRKEGMIHISGELPSFGLSHQEIYCTSLPRKNISINVSRTREPQSIAADITHRLMPDYLLSVIAAEQEVSDYRNRMEVIKAVEHAFRCVVPDLSGYSHNQYETTRRRYQFSTGQKSYRRGELEVSFHDGLSCDLKLCDLPADLAMRIIGLLQSGLKRE